MAGRDPGFRGKSLEEGGRARYRQGMDTFRRIGRCYQPWDIRHPEHLTSAQMSEKDYLDKRKEVLSRWPTGREVEDLDAAVAYASSMTRARNWVLAFKDALPENKPWVTTNTGFATIERTTDGLRHVVDAGADYVRISADVYTKKCDYGRAQAELEKAIDTGKNTLNGLPFVNYGVHPLRHMLEQLNVPANIATGVDESTLLQQEIANAAGIVQMGIFGVAELAMHHKDYPLDQKILDVQYRCRSAVYYEERGVPFDMMAGAPLSGQEPPSIENAINIIDLLLAAGQGARHLSISVNTGGNLLQDAANHRVLRRLGPDYLKKMGFADVDFTVGSFSYTGKWPEDEASATAFLSWMVSISCLSGADWVKIKTFEEAKNIPQPVAQASSVRLAKYLIRTMRGQRLPPSEELEEEETMIELETRAIVDAALELGAGDPVQGLMKAVKAGVIDVAYSGWKYMARQVLVARDAHGAKRYLHPGNLPLPARAFKYNLARIAERKARSKIEDDIEMIVQDVCYAG
jgi:methylaspartate mutase epsilon subunit